MIIKFNFIFADIHIDSGVTAENFTRINLISTKKQWIVMKDELDAKILQFLQENSRVSYAHIGREIGLSASAIGERVQRLEDTEIIKGYTAVIDQVKTGHGISSYILMSVESKTFQSFIDALHNFPEIEQCSRVTGQDCLIMKFNLKDSNHLKEVIDRLAHYGNPSTHVILSEIIANGKVL